MEFTNGVWGMEATNRVYGMESIHRSRITFKGMRNTHCKKKERIAFTQAQLKLRCVFRKEDHDFPTLAKICVEAFR